MHFQLPDGGTSDLLLVSVPTALTRRNSSSSY